MYFFRVAIIVLIVFVSLKLYSIFEFEELLLEDDAVAEEDTNQEQIEKEQNLVQEISPGEAQVLIRLSERHQELQKMEEVLNDKEILLEATKQYMEVKVIKLEELQDNIKKLIKEYQQLEEEKIRSLVKIYENMRPQDAAQIFDDLDIRTLLPVIDRMREVKVAALLAKMRPEKARQITVRFANDHGRLEPKNYNLCLCE